MSTVEPVEGTLKVWHISPVPGEPFEIEPVASLAEAVVLLDTLAYYDLYQHAHQIRGEFSNVQGAARFVDGEWEDVDDDELEVARETSDEKDYTS